MTGLIISGESEGPKHKEKGNDATNAMRERWDEVVVVFSGIKCTTLTLGAGVTGLLTRDGTFIAFCLCHGIPRLKEVIDRPVKSVHGCHSSRICVGCRTFEIEEHTSELQ